MSVKVRFIVPMKLFQNALAHCGESEPIRLNVCPVPLAYPAGLPVPEGWVECEVAAPEWWTARIDEQVVHEGPDLDLGPGSVLRFLRDSPRKSIAEEEADRELAEDEREPPPAESVNLNHHADCPSRTSRHTVCICDDMYDERYGKSPLESLRNLAEIKQVWSRLSLVEQNQFLTWAAHEGVRKAIDILKGE